MSVLTNKRPLFFIVIAIILLIFFYFSQYIHKQSHSKENEFNKLSYNIDLQSIKLNSVSKKLNQYLSYNRIFNKSAIDSTIYDNDFDCFIFENDSIIYWNNSSIVPDNLSGLIRDKNIHCAKLPTGWYLYTVINIENKNVFLFDLIKSDYQMNNPLLLQGFVSGYSNSKNINLTLDIEQSTYKIYNSNDNFILGVTFRNDINETIHGNILAYILLLLSIIFIIISAYTWIVNLKYFTKHQEIKLLVIVTIIFAIWMLLHLFDFPNNITNKEVASINQYNIWATKTPADILVNSMFLMLTSVFIFLVTRHISSTLSPVKIIIKYTIFWIYSLLAFVLIYNAIQYQNIPYISDIVFTGANIYMSIIAVLLLNIGIYYTFLSLLNFDSYKKAPFFIPIIITFFGLAISYVLFDIDPIIIMLVLFVTTAITIIKYFLWKHITDVFLKNILLLIIISITTSVLINLSIKEKEDNYQKYIAQTLATPNDIVFEKAFSSIYKHLKTDIMFKEVVLDDSIGVLAENYLRENYFNGYFNKYDIQITNCGTNELIEIQPNKDIYNCYDYFNSLIKEFTISTIDSVLYQFNSETEGYYYISYMRITDPENPDIERNLFIEFVTSHVPEGLGYPELLVDSESQPLNLSNFSFARYTKNLLTYKFGEYSYNTYFQEPEKKQLNKFIKDNNSRHFIIQTTKDSFLIVTRKEVSISMKVVVFSLTFLLLTFISIAIYFIVYARKAFLLFRLNFKTRLQTFVIGTLTITFILIAVSTLYYIEENSKKEMEKQLTEKANSVLIELQHKLSTVTDLKNQDREFLHQLLRKFSLVFFSDINLYDKSGQLIATSRPEIFDKNLLSTYINPIAYNAIFVDNELNYITEEKIGSLQYYSSYVPINLNSYFPIGIVNLPYFARQSEYTKSYYTMLSFLINIYVIIGIIGTLIAVIFSRYLTRPLVLLQENISNIRIDKQNEKISWNKNDEIGLLIKEYNRMVEKLEQSAELLVRSERESAWREVAKQIAHEIKNPLTPMKLNVQYLERAYKNNDPDFSSKIDSISKSMIAQIDTLDNVAETFSNFAKIKNVEFEKINLKNVLTTAIDLFDKKSNVNITTEYENNDDGYYILGHEKDTLRVINNILKNSTQAVENIKSGLIKITVVNKDKFIEVAISDNGKGIPEEMKSSIFQPYFTTKTSGTGLGLAIVKNIVSETGGEVYFESTINEGTTFFLRFPVAT